MELWTEIGTDSSLRVRADEDRLIPIPPPARSSKSDVGSIFDKLIDDYDVLAERAEDMVFQHVCGEIEMELKAHFFRYVQIPERMVLGCFIPGEMRFNVDLILTYVCSTYPPLLPPWNGTAVTYRGNTRNLRLKPNTTTR